MYGCVLGIATIVGPARLPRWNLLAQLLHLLRLSDASFTVSESLGLQDGETGFGGEQTEK